MSYQKQTRVKVYYLLMSFSVVMRSGVTYRNSDAGSVGDGVVLVTDVVMAMGARRW